DASAHERLGTSGHSLVASLLSELKYLPLNERRECAERVFRLNAGTAEAPRLMMTAQMVADLARRGFDIGGHTMSHPILKGLGADEAKHEIAACRRWVRDTTGKDAVSFAYPNGRPGRDFDEA